MTITTRELWAGIRGVLGRTLTIAVVLLGICVVAGAQGGAEGTTPPYLTRGLPAGTYPLSGFDSVNLFNGNLNFHLPLMEVVGRGGARVPMMAKIEARWRVVLDNCAPPCGPIAYPTYNWWTGYEVGYGPGLMVGRSMTWDTQQCIDGSEIPGRSLLRLTFTSADGTEYELRDNVTDGAPQTVPNYPGCPPLHWFDRGTVFVTADGSSATFYSCQPDGTPIHIYDSDWGVIPYGILLLRDGTRYRIDGGLVSWMQDRNGNRLTFYYEHTDPQNHPDGRVTRIIDSLNRQITITYDVAAGTPYGTCDEISFQGFNGTSRTIRVSKDLISNVLRSPYQIHTYHDLFPNFSGSGSTPFDDYVTSAVWLPDGRAYKFYYNDYGELARMVLPTGGAVEYDWGVGMNGAPTGGSNGWGGIYRRVLERRTYPDGASGNSFASKQTFSVPETYALGGPPATVGYVTVKQFDSSLNLLTDSVHYFNGSAVFNPNDGDYPVGYFPWNSGKEYKTEELDTNGTTVLRKVEHTFYQTAPTWWTPPYCPACIPAINNPRITETLTTWVQANQVAKQSYDYDQYFNRKLIKEYDYGTGSPPTYPTRQTEIDYVTTGETNAIDYTGSSIGSNVNSIPYLRSLPMEQRVYSVNISTGATTLAGKTHFYYDETSLTPRSGITGWQSPVTDARGNLTTTSRWRDTPTAGWISTTQKYDIAGHVVESTDALNSTSLIDYASSSNTYAFPTTFKTPVPDSSGLQGSNARLQTLVDYDLASGLVKSITDPNGQITTASYDNDALDRLKVITRPTGGGQTFYTYGDTIGSLFVRTQTTQDANQTLDSYQYFDGFGRATRASQAEASGSIFVETQYDALGRVYQTSNPYRAADTTKRWTTNQYDALSRVVTVTQSGGAVTSSSYSGNSVTITDPATKNRKTVSDALGRMTSVIEDPGSSPHLNYQTSYNYDALDNLRKVVQGGQARYFGYDSLKRLLRVRNPEQDFNTSIVATDPVTSNNQWCAAYTYDDNSNLSTRLDPRNITSTYIYDAINRVKTRSYSSDPTQTPGVVYKYDGLGVTAPQNALGKLTSVATSGTFVSSYTYDTFDAMGRVLHSTQTTEGTTYGMSYGYDLAGNLISETYPSGRVVVTAFDTAGRTSDVSSALTHYESSFSYAAHGGVTDVKLGNDLWEHTTFEPNRLQPTDIYLGTSSGGYDKLKLGYGYGSLAANNGNVMSQTITIGSTVMNQSYAYDGVNRLQTATETGAWTQTYDCDRFGNRAVRNTSSYIPSPSLTPQSVNSTDFSAFNQGTNRIQLSGFGYDVAGNLKNDPTTAANAILYDAENRQVSYTKSGTTTYSYDGDGRRVKKVAGSITTVFVYNAMGQLTAEYTNDTTPPVGGGGTSYLTSDQLGSTRLVTKSDGSVKARYDYLPFGEEIPSSVGGRSVVAGYGGADSTKQKFTQKERDNESGLDYFLARYYSSAQGRFTGADPVTMTSGRRVDPQEINLYAYARNNPLRWTDPTGEIIVENVDKNHQEEYEKWKKAFLATKSGKAQWEKYANDKDFTLTITVGANVGGKEGAETGKFEFDSRGKLSGATITLGQGLGKNRPRNSADYPITGSLTPSDQYGYPIDRSARVVAIFAHEFGHVDWDRSLGPLFQRQQQLLEQWNQRYLQVGIAGLETDAQLQQIRSQLGDSPANIDQNREIEAERAVIPVLQEHFGKNIPNRVKKAIEEYKKEHP